MQVHTPILQEPAAAQFAVRGIIVMQWVGRNVVLVSTVLQVPLSVAPVQ